MLAAAVCASSCLSAASSFSLAGAEHAVVGRGFGATLGGGARLGAARGAGGLAAAEGATDSCGASATGRALAAGDSTDGAGAVADPQPVASRINPRTGPSARLLITAGRIRQVLTACKPAGKN